MEHLDSIIRESKAMGSYFFGILGGEPLLYQPLIEVFRKHPECYFQLFTNGTLLTTEVADTSGSVNERERLKQMPPVPGHGPAEIIPEKSRIYRFAKKNAFFGLGAHG